MALTTKVHYGQGVEAGEGVYDKQVWVVSCRSTRSLDLFSRKVLMYKPDLRSFCPHGKRCVLFDDEVHQSLYIHGEKPVDRSKTLVFGTTRRKSPRIPHISQAWEIGRNKLANGVRLDGIPVNKTAVVFVHGFRDAYGRIISYLNHFGAEPVFLDPEVVRFAFVWPSQEASYFRARYYTERAAQILQNTLGILRNHGNRIVLVGHSMGCRVCLHSLMDWKDGQVEHLFLVGAAVASDVLNRGKQFDACRVSAKSITVLHSKRDRDLATNFKLAEFIPGLYNFRLAAATLALGLSGVPDGKPIDPKVDSVDCTSQVNGHSTHLYLNSSIAVGAMRTGIEKILKEKQLLSNL
mmetsp:Transcript_4830/g.7311  ORF Transcript_4830/g.7311 Transcript_4830/m.7311 type:complete len:350 (-) Transcript_4830:1771-2820(-)